VGFLAAVADFRFTPPGFGFERARGVVLEGFDATNSTTALIHLGTTGQTGETARDGNGVRHAGSGGRS
jgi:hypothetical protein